MLSRRNFLFGLALAPIGVVALKNTAALPYGEQTIVPIEGKIVTFYTDGVQQGTISIAGNTDIYGTFMGSHWVKRY